MLLGWYLPVLLIVGLALLVPSRIELDSGGGLRMVAFQLVKRRRLVYIFYMMPRFLLPLC